MNEFLVRYEPIYIIYIYIILYILYIYYIYNIYIIYIYILYIYCIYVKYGRVSLQRHLWVASFAARLSTTLFLLSTWSQKQRAEQCDPPAATSMKYCLVRKQSQLKKWMMIIDSINMYKPV